MATNVLTTSGKWATNGNWSLGHKPEAKEDVEIPAGKEAKVEAAGLCRSLFVNGGTLAASSKIEVGNSEKPEAGTAGYVLKIAAGSTISFTGPLELVSTFAAEAQKISVDKTITLKSELLLRGKGKYRLEETLLSNKVVHTEGEGVLETNGFKLECQEFIGGGSAGERVIAGTSEIVSTGGTGFTLQAGQSLASAKLVQTGGSKFSGGGNTIGEVKIEAAGIEIQSSNTIGTLRLNTKTLAATKFEKGSTQAITTFAHNGASGELVKLVSTEAGKEWKLKKASGNVNTDFLELTDSHVDASPKWYAGTHSTNVSGNENWKFEAEPAEGGPVTGKASGAMLLTGTSSATVRSVITGKATGALLLAGTGTGVLRSVVSAQASGAILFTGTSKGSTAGAVRGKATGALTLTGSAAGTVRAVVTGKATGSLIFTGTATGTLHANVAGKATGALLLTGSARSTAEPAGPALIFGDVITGRAVGASIGRDEGATTGRRDR